MKNVLLDKGIILPSGEISKDKADLVTGVITQPFAEMVWVTTGSDMENVNRLADVLVTMNTLADRGKLFALLNVLLTGYYNGKPRFAKLTQKKSAAKSYKGTGLFAIIIYPFTFYCSFLRLDMSVQFLSLTKIIHTNIVSFFEKVKLSEFW